MDFGISESCLHRWMKDADVEEGVRDGMTAAERNELRESRKRIKVLEQENYIFAVRRRIYPRAAPQNEIPAGP